MGAMVFPNEETNLVNVWKESAAQWLARPENQDKAIGDFIPGDMPHRFRAILAAMAHKNMDIPANKRTPKKTCPVSAQILCLDPEKCPHGQRYPCP